MDLINELGNELALSLLVEKKFIEKIESSDVPSLIDRVKHILQTISSAETGKYPPNKIAKSISH